MPLKLLILGGTSEATAFAAALAGDRRFAPVLSLAGATHSPRPAPIPTRVGGFGGLEGLVRYLREQGAGAVVVATHPFAAQIKRHAVEASRATALPLLLLERPAWQEQAGDNWIRVATAEQAAAALGPVPRRVLLTTGRKNLAAFAAHPQHSYVVRTVDPPEPRMLPPGAELLCSRGPFDLPAERDLLCTRRIEVLVTKNAGGRATEAKLHAARALSLPVVVIDRPTPPVLEDMEATQVPDVAGALAWLEERVHARSPTERGV